MVRTSSRQLPLLAAALLFGCAAGSPAAQSTTDATLPESGETIELALGGDVMFGRWRDGEYEPYENGTMIETAGAPLGAADLALANLETAVCERETAATSASPGIRLTAPPERIATLEKFGLDIVSVANNHATDCGDESLDGTVRRVEAGGADVVGIEDAVTSRRVSGVEILAVGATLHPPRLPSDYVGSLPWVMPGYDVGPLIERVAQLRSAHAEALILVSIHWGMEGAPEPSARQVDSARKLVDAGADVIHGHGTHTVQRVENYAGGTIAYGLGNLHFDMRRRGAAARAVVLVTCEVQDERRCRAELRRLPTAK